jgi:hypothetical protein
VVNYAALVGDVAGSPRRNGGAFRAFWLFWRGCFGTKPPTRSSKPMERASKSGRAVIPEPSFGFFLRAMGAMLLLVIIMTAYFSLRA